MIVDCRGWLRPVTIFLCAAAASPVERCVFVLQCSSRMSVCPVGLLLDTTLGALTVAMRQSLAHRSRHRKVARQVRRPLQ
jgi:hypothetical protein